MNEPLRQKLMIQADAERACLIDRRQLVRRRAPRFSFGFRAFISVQGEQGDACEGVGMDISESGMRFLLDHQMPVGAKLSLWIPAASGTRERVGATVVRCREVDEGIFDLGVFFLQPIQVSSIIADAGRAAEPDARDPR